MWCLKHVHISHHLSKEQTYNIYLKYIFYCKNILFIQFYSFFYMFLHLLIADCRIWLFITQRGPLQWRAPLKPAVWLNRKSWRKCERLMTMTSLLWMWVCVRELLGQSTCWVLHHCLQVQALYQMLKANSQRCRYI